MTFDSVRKIAFPSCDGRDFELMVNLETNLIELKESIDGESQTLTTSTAEIKTLAYFIAELEKQSNRTYPNSTDLVS